MFKFSEGLNQKPLHYLRCQINLLHFTSFKPNQTNYYDILNVPRGASQKEIKDSYLKLCKLHHPDASNNSNLSKDEKVKKFQKINEAYQCLSKPESKMAYDRTGSNSNAQYSNPYANSKTRAYPKRPDGYRPYGQYSYEQSFRNKNSFYKNQEDEFEQFFKQRFSNGPPFKDFDVEFKNEKPSNREIVRMFIFFTISIVLYIFMIRYLSIILNEESGLDQLLHLPDDEEDEDPNEDPKEFRYMFDPVRGRYIRIPNKSGTRRYTGYKFEGDEEFTGHEKRFRKNPLTENFPQMED